MKVNPTIFKELIKRGHSVHKKTRVWDISDSKLWYLTPELSKGFLNLFKFEPYRKNVVDKELNLLKDHTHSIVKMFGEKNFNLIDLGCGGGLKTAAFVKSLPKDVKLRYCPVDISSYFINKATRKVRELKSKNIAGHKPFVSDFEDLDDIVGILRGGDYQKNLVLLLGETLSHYDINDFLFKISENMFNGDFIVIGNGIRKGKRFVSVDKYKSPLFNEWFIHIIKGLGLNDSEVDYSARFAHGRLEGYYRINVNKKVRNNGKTVNFRKGDEIVVGIQYKFFENELKRFCKMYFTDVKLFTDRTGEYALVLCNK